MAILRLRVKNTFIVGQNRAQFSYHNYILNFEILHFIKYWKIKGFQFNLEVKI